MHFTTTLLKNKIIFLLLSWTLVQGFLLWHNGMVTGFEASKYIDEANYYLRYGNFTSANYHLYSTQIFLIALAIKFRLGFTVIVVLQLLLNLLATYMFYKLTVSFFAKPFFAIAATFFFIVNIPYQVYNSFLFTESVFYSLTIIYSSYLLRLKGITIKNVLALLLFIALLSITRPTGILFFAATAVYLFCKFLNKKNAAYLILLFLSSIVMFLIIINIMLQAGGSLDFMLPFKKENIICGVNTVSHSSIKTFETGNSLQGIIYYVFKNGHQFINLCWLKTAAFFGMLRNYYSLFHNIFLVIFFYPFYILSFPGIGKKIKDKRIIYFISIIFLFWITTLLTCDDWHNRFILTITPFLFLLGFAAFSNKLYSEKENTNVDA